jgi:polysaccharide deacetylase family protein (PEP-CTERM system associated)
MNILTFDIEDWYNCDYLSRNFDWDKLEVRIYANVERILAELAARNLKATFFCLGWIAERHPDVVRQIQKQGHEIGCHSYQHELAFRLTSKEFKNDTDKAKKLLEDVTGAPVECYRAPGFSITKNNLWALEIIAEAGFKYDCSIFTAKHDNGGYSGLGVEQPLILNFRNGMQIKEFPVVVKKVMGSSMANIGGGYFRLMPYFLVRQWIKASPYTCCYFHPRDFDTGQPVIKTLPLKRRFKSYVGIRSALNKFKHLLDDCEFISLYDADAQVDWSQAPAVTILV